MEYSFAGFLILAYLFCGTGTIIWGFGKFGKPRTFEDWGGAFLMFLLWPILWLDSNSF